MAADSITILRSTDAGLDVDQLFLSRAFNAYQAQAQGKALVTFVARAAGSAEPQASLTIAGTAGQWTNPVTGAFGGVVTKPDWKPTAVADLVVAMTAWLRSEAGAQAATIRLPPDCFPDPAAAALENALFQSGWRLHQVDLDQYLPVTAADDFSRGLGETKQKELRRLKRSGAQILELPAAAAEPVYAVIARNRAARGFPMTMTWAQLQALAAAFPDRVSFQAVARDGALLAGSVLLQLTHGYRYVFYWGEDPGVRREAPVVVLAEHLVRRCHEQGAAILDIGTSTEQSEINEGLFAFKNSLGCRTAAKRTYRLDLDPA